MNKMAGCNTNTSTTVPPLQRQYEPTAACATNLHGKQLEFEVRTTRILSTMPIGEGVSWGTDVGPGAIAAYHQHLFSLRIDPAIDGFSNTVIYEDSVTLPISKDLNTTYSNSATIPRWTRSQES